MKIHVAIFWVVTPCSVVVGYWHLGEHCCLHLQVVTPCCNVIRYHRFGGPCCLHRQAVTPFSDVVGYRRFGGPCSLSLQGEVTQLYVLWLNTFALVFFLLFCIGTIHFI